MNTDETRVRTTTRRDYSRWTFSLTLLAPMAVVATLVGADFLARTWIGSLDAWSMAAAGSGTVMLVAGQALCWRGRARREASGLGWALSMIGLIVSRPLFGP